MATAFLEHDDDSPQLRLLNGFDLCQNGRSLPLRLGSQRLLAFLALADKKLERAAAAYRLWPDKTERRATANLRSALWRIHQVPIDLVDTTTTHIRLRPEVWVDIRDGRTDLVRLSGTPVAGGMAAALCGDLLPDWYDDWLLIERERLRQDRLHALETAIDHLLESGELPTAIDLGLQAVAMEPLRESAHRLVVRAHLLEGNLAEAIRQYETCRQLLLTELGPRRRPSSEP